MLQYLIFFCASHRAFQTVSAAETGETVSFNGLHRNYALALPFCIALPAGKTIFIAVRTIDIVYSQSHREWSVGIMKEHPRK